MKKCIKCEEEKKLNEFGKYKSSKDGLWVYCKSCTNEMEKIRRNNNPEYFKEKNRRYKEKYNEQLKEWYKKNYILKREKRLENQRLYYWKNRQEISLKSKLRVRTEEFKKKVKEYREKNKEKLKIQNDAHKMVSYAVKLGLIVKPENCEICFIKCKTEAHHEDHFKQLEVVWVCRKCHRKIEKKGN